MSKQINKKTAAWIAGGAGAAGLAGGAATGWGVTHGYHKRERAIEKANEERKREIENAYLRKLRDDRADALKAARMLKTAQLHAIDEGTTDFGAIKDFWKRGVARVKGGAAKTKEALGNVDGTIGKAAKSMVHAASDETVGRSVRRGVRRGIRDSIGNPEINKTLRTAIVTGGVAIPVAGTGMMMTSENRQRAKLIKEERRRRAQQEMKNPNYGMSDRRKTTDFISISANETPEARTARRRGNLSDVYGMVNPRTHVTAIRDSIATGRIASVNSKRKIAEAKAMRQEWQAEKRAKRQMKQARRQQEMGAGIETTDFQLSGGLSRIDRAFHRGPVAGNLGQAVRNEASGLKRRLKRGWEQMSPKYGGGPMDQLKRGAAGFRRGAAPVQKTAIQYGYEPKTTDFNSLALRQANPSLMGAFRAGRIQAADSAEQAMKRKMKRKFQAANDSDQVKALRAARQNAKEGFQQRRRSLMDAGADTSDAWQHQAAQHVGRNAGRYAAGLGMGAAGATTAGVLVPVAMRNKRERREKMEKVRSYRSQRRDMGARIGTTDFAGQLAIRPNAFVRGARRVGRWGQDVWGGPARRANAKATRAADNLAQIEAQGGAGLGRSQRAMMDKANEEAMAASARTRRARIQAGIGAGVVGLGTAGAVIPAVASNRRKQEERRFSQEMQFLNNLNRVLDAEIVSFEHDFSRSRNTAGQFASVNGMGAANPGAMALAYGPGQNSGKPGDVTGAALRTPFEGAGQRDAAATPFLG